MDIPLYFSAVSTKGNNLCVFLFAFLHEVALPEWTGVSVRGKTLFS